MDAASEAIRYQTRVIEDDFYSPEITVLADGRLRLCVGGTCKDRDVRTWHKQEEELFRWQQFANYCRSCALSGEHAPQTFEEFDKYQTARELKERLDRSVQSGQ